MEARRVWGLRAELEESPLVCAGPGPSRRTGSFQAADVALELGPGEAAAAADVHCVQLPGLHEGVDRGAADAEHLGGLLGCEQQRVAGHRLPMSLRVAHVALLVGRPRAPAFGAAAHLEKAPFSADW